MNWDERVASYVLKKLGGGDDEFEKHRRAFEWSSKRFHESKDPDTMRFYKDQAEAAPKAHEGYHQG